MTPLQALDTNEIKVAHPQPWSAQTLTSIDGVNLRYRVMRDTVASFHVHDDSPECFLVLSGEVVLDTEAGPVTLTPGMFYRVEPGMSHRSRVVGEACLLVMDKMP